MTDPHPSPSSRTAESSLVSVPCDLCGRWEADTLFVKEGFPHVRCTGCGLVRVSPRRRDHLLAQRDEGTGQMGEEKPNQRHLQWLKAQVNRLERYRGTGSLLEIGPGMELFLDTAAESGWETWAVEINRQAAGRLADDGRHRVLTGSIAEAELPDGRFDAVRLWDVIEHLESPTGALKTIFRALRPGGALLLSTPNLASLSFKTNGPDWIYLNGADHIHLFEPDTIRDLLGRTGFETVRLTTHDFNLKKKLYFPEQTLPHGRPLIKPFGNLLRKVVPLIGQGHQMIVLATRPE